MLLPHYIKVTLMRSLLDILLLMYRRSSTMHHKTTQHGHQAPQLVPTVHVSTMVRLIGLLLVVPLVVQLQLGTQHRLQGVMVESRGAMLVK